MRFITILIGILSLSSWAAASYQCRADCNTYCRELVFSERPDSHSGERCKELGGNFGGYRDGSYTCVRHTNNIHSVSGSGELQADAKRDAYNTCYDTHRRDGADYYCGISSVNNYKCED